MSDVSVIGLGLMGAALARTLLAKGYSVTVWNRSAEKAAPLVEAGAALAATSAEAVAASPLTITCVKSHPQTSLIVADWPEDLSGKTVIELSTGGAAEAEALAAQISAKGADWMIGIINAYPSAVGGEETVLLTVGSEESWARWGVMIRALGGKSAHVGTEAGMIAALFAALFTTRQGFMFGMIYGGLICKKAGIPLKAFSDQIPVSLGVLPSYYKAFADTVPSGNYDNPQATMTTYAAALDDALATFTEAGAPAELPQLFSDLAHKGIDAGWQDKALTGLVELLSRE